VTVRARVDGQLEKVAFVEGQDVHVKDLLAQIDPAPYRASLDQAVAKKAQDSAQLADAQIDLQRNKTLVEKQINSQQALDTQQALVNQLDAAVKADQAAIESAQVQLDYTTILSPLDGRTGMRIVDQGNIVHATDTGGLVVITQLKPISVVFTLPEQTLDQIHGQMSIGRTADTFTVLAVDRDNRTNLGEGRLAVIDNQIDVTTGTIKLKATFPNEDLRLWPGQFVNVRLLLETRKNGIVVPTPVVQRGPGGAYAFVVQGQGTNLTVTQQTITLVLSSTGEAVNYQGDTLVDGGLEPGQTVVVDGQYKLQSGSKVLPAPTGGARGTNQPALEAANP
jgi:multidrug efflux system membrane fusion protein